MRSAFFVSLLIGSACQRFAAASQSIEADVSADGTISQQFLQGRDANEDHFDSIYVRQLNNKAAKSGSATRTATVTKSAKSTKAADNTVKSPKKSLKIRRELLVFEKKRSDEEQRQMTF